MKIIVIGAVAAGTSAAAKARRNNEKANIVIYEKDHYISYSGCGMPYFISGEMDSFEQLIPRDPDFFKEKYNVDILTGHEVQQINSQKKTVLVRRLADQTVFEDQYDRLILATGAMPVKLPVPGHDLANVFCMRSPGDTWAIDQYMQKNRPQQAVIIGSGFIGMEMVESFSRTGMEVILIEKMPHLNPGLDPDMSKYIEQYLTRKKIRWICNAEVTEIIGGKLAEAVSVKGMPDIAADLVLTAIGIRPATSLAAAAGIELGKTRAIKVDQHMKTNIPAIFACGDCCESFSVIDGQPIYRPLGSTANKMGRIAGDVVSGGSLAFHGIAGTGIFRLFDLTVAQTGMTETEAHAKGYRTAIIHNIKPDRPEYMGGRDMVIKAVADRESQRLLGAQIVGYEGVDKRIDILATAITYGARASELADLDLAYAPPFATTRDPVIYTGMIMDNVLNQGRDLISAEQLSHEQDAEVMIIDTRSPDQFARGHVKGAVNIPHAEVRKRLPSFPRDKLLVTYCNKGTTGNAVQNILINSGFTRSRNLSGGHRNYCCQTEVPENQISDQT